MNTTLNAIRAYELCSDGWQKLLSQLGKTTADNEALSILTILDSNGLHDALLCLRAVTGHDREIRLYAVWCARQVQYLMDDPRSLRALDIADAYANGQATQIQLTAAGEAALAAAKEAAGVAALNAAKEAAGFAALAAALAAGKEAAGVAALNAALAAAWAAERDDARDDAEASQEARLRELCASEGDR